ncbi:vitamin B12 transporter [Sphingobium sp. B1D7B]|uniref:TonB-dependent receptor plug domain-containing protein n=1 Tax=Sphingobium sp. B1D7B TaxID=2940578 RepID=UPI0022259407|nr:TonB-dependent receptor [Sphingobium sp. B1D7B]MCW2406849.1 vitamin B12 transporter [Sphingobium sp. B1D7B]
MAGAPAEAQGQAQQNQILVITATGTPQDRDESGQAITVIDAATIEISQARSVTDLLARLPSVRATTNGSLGSVSGVSLRGAETGQTLVLLDGVRVNDPSSTSDAADFGNLLVGNIRGAEVMRGSNAIAYGSSAIGGVVNLTTRDPDAPEGLSARVSVEGGYAATVQSVADIGWRRGDLRADAGIVHLRTDGISSAAPRFGATERDALENWTAHARIEVPISDGLSLDLRGYGIDATLDYDSFFGEPADSTDESRFRQFTGHAGVNASSFDGRLISRFAVTYLANSRDYRFIAGAAPDFGYRGAVWRLDYRGKVALGASADLLMGYTHDVPVYRFYGFGSEERHAARTDSGYAMFMLKPLQRLSLTGGVRHDAHSQFGGVTTFGANANLGLDDQTRLRAAFGQGFRAPSLYQLYDAYSGNAALAPERSDSFDVGFDRRLFGGRGQLALTVFKRRTRRQIDYDGSTFRYVNLARTSTTGLELEARFAPVDGLDLQLAYSLLDTRDQAEHHLPRRPVHGLSASLDKAWVSGFSTGISLRYASAAVDRTSPTGTLDSYVLADLRAAWALSERFELFGRVENAFDRMYETAYGYGTYGRAVYGGLRVTL